MFKEMEIYFRDLNEVAQKEILEFYGMEDASEGGWDNFPLAILGCEDEDA